ncbi:MAG TPA: GGDEF domain-containing protein [Pirellulaceae bacterium]|nr:GGDEF domain-containing protein [Pirellulaceae bacterium]HMO92492.1 GGDEF domain-containing protein [Pirellulaceae bacterium]HMP69025.1 GGDEF domain-containing protein [Pirellulaceae bacterium]
MSKRVEQQADELRSVINQLAAELDQSRMQNEALQKLVRNLQQEALTDELSGLWNRRFFDQQIAKLQARLDNGGESYCIALLDLDHLKQINDRFGHVIGDVVIQQVSRQLKELMVPADDLCRIGGDEFAVIMTNTSLAKAQARIKEVVDQLDLVDLAAKSIIIWNRLREDSQKSVPSPEQVFQDRGPLNVSLCIGIAEAMPGESGIQLLDRADRNLYESKQGTAQRHLRD